jgi:FkbM family methyltransferase
VTQDRFDSPGRSSAGNSGFIPVRRLISTASNLIPQGIKRKLLGSPAAPSRIANWVHSFLNRLPGPEFVCLPCAGVLAGYRMKVDWSHHRSFIHGTWEPEVIQTIQEVVSEGSFAIDIGAHIGFYTLVLSRLVGPAGRVIAFEPVPKNFSILEENVAMNGCSHVKVIKKALLEESRRVMANAPDNEPLPGSVSVFTDYGTDATSVEATTLDEFMHFQKARVDFIKMDVEGAENLVLQGAKFTIEAQHPTMVIEVHHFDGSPESSPVLGQLEAWGYQTRWINRWEATSHLLAMWGRAGHQTTERDGQKETA